MLERTLRLHDPVVTVWCGNTTSSGGKDWRLCPQQVVGQRLLAARRRSEMAVLLGIQSVLKNQCSSRDALHLNICFGCSLFRRHRAARWAPAHLCARARQPTWTNP